MHIGLNMHFIRRSLNKTDFHEKFSYGRNELEKTWEVTRAKERNCIDRLPNRLTGPNCLYYAIGYVGFTLIDYHLIQISRAVYNC